MKILHVISNLGQGGAEAVLYRLILASKKEFSHEVVSLTDEGYYGPRLCASGVRVHTLDKPRGRVTLAGILKLKRLMAENRPDVVQTWMYHADLVGGLVARWVGVRSVVWAIRHSNLAADKSSFSTRASAKACSLLSTWVPAAISCCSLQAAQVHKAIGYSARKFVLIPNGYDLSRYVPDANMRLLARNKLGISSETTLLGLVARWDPQKDHENLLAALARITMHHSHVRCVLVGQGMDQQNEALVRMVTHHRLEEVVILAGPQDDVPAVMNALDLHVLSSAGEAFPNAVAEAMACGTPCVVTDVGDARMIVGETGWVVRPHDSEALAAGILQALVAISQEGRTAVGQACRTRIEEKFSLAKMVQAYEAMWVRVCADGAAKK